MARECERYDFRCILGNLYDDAEQAFYNGLHTFLNGVVGLINSIPVPDFLKTTYQVPDTIVFFAGAFNLHYGLGIIILAFIIRFIIRRIPVVG